MPRFLGAGFRMLVPRLDELEVWRMGALDRVLVQVLPLVPRAIVGLLLFIRLQPDGSYVTDLLPGIVLCSIGMGLTFVPITLIATSGIPLDDAGLASGLFNTSQQVGGALGLAVLATLAVDATQETLSAVGGEPQPADQAQALVDGFHVAYAGSAILVAAAAVLLLFLLRRVDVVAVGEGELATEPAAA